LCMTHSIASDLAFASSPVVVPVPFPVAVAVAVPVLPAVLVVVPPWVCHPSSRS
jgi:hypothetical protein